MKTQTRTPLWLYLAALAMVGLALAVGFRLAAVPAVLVAILLGVLVLRQSRVAWTVVLLGALGQLLEALVVRDLDWTISVNLVIAGCLLAPSSCSFVWRSHGRKQGSEKWLTGFSQGIQDHSYGALAYFAGWETEIKSNEPWEPGRFRSLLIRLGACTLVLLVLVTITYSWQQAQPSRIIDIIANVTWTVYAVFQVALIVTGLFMLVRYLKRDRGASPPSSRSGSSAAGP